VVSLCLCPMEGLGSQTVNLTYTLEIFHCLILNKETVYKNVDLLLPELTL
jgi:hypothetical protein